MNHNDDLQNLTRKTDVLLEKNLNGDITDAQFKSLNSRYSQEAELLEQSLIKLKLKEEDESLKENDDSKIKKLYEKVMSIEKCPVEEQRYILMDLIEKITICDGKIVIDYKFSE